MGQVDDAAVRVLERAGPGTSTAIALTVKSRRPRSPASVSPYATSGLRDVGVVGLGAVRRDLDLPRRPCGRRWCRRPGPMSQIASAQPVSSRSVSSGRADVVRSRSLPQPAEHRVAHRARPPGRGRGRRRRTARRAARGRARSGRARRRPGAGRRPSERRAGRVGHDRNSIVRRRCGHAPGERPRPPSAADVASVTRALRASWRHRRRIESAPCPDRRPCCLPSWPRQRLLAAAPAAPAAAAPIDRPRTRCW